MNEKVVMVSKLVWMMQEQENKVELDSEDIHTQSFICGVLTKKMAGFKLGIKIPDMLSLMLEVCTDGNLLNLSYCWLRYLNV
jgi:hypothetical protein